MNRTWLWPMLLAVCTVFGLLTALLVDARWGAVVGCLGLGVPLLAMLGRMRLS